MQNFNNQTHSFDDVLLVPQHSDILSREEVNIGSELGNERYGLPIISSPMDTVTGEKMADVFSRHSALAVTHRYCTPEEQAKITPHSAAAAVGVTGDFVERIHILNSEKGIRTFCLDVAHGHHMLVERALKKIRDKYGDTVSIIAGNVATAKGYADLSEWGADAVRVGIGGGSICSTRIQTGHGVPTFQSVYNCANQYDGAKIIADGGIKTSGDIVKALAAGADFVMLGSMLAGTEESPGQTFQDNDGKKYKVYRGMASKEAQIKWRGKTSSLEGISTFVACKGTVEQVINELETGIRSGFSYSGARCLNGLHSNAKFIKQTNASMSESSTHILKRN